MSKITMSDLEMLQNQVGLFSAKQFDNKKRKEYESIFVNGGTLPPNIIRRKHPLNGDVQYYEIEKTDLTEEEQKQYMFLKLMSDVQSMKNCMIFFTVITIISLIATLFVSCSVMG
mgnify:CR=1 FL=1